MNKPFKFKEWDLVPRWGHYPNGRHALAFVDAHDGAPILTASVNVVDEFIGDDEIIIKNYEENIGILPLLIENGYIRPPHRIIRTGFTHCGLCKLAGEVPE